MGWGLQEFRWVGDSLIVSARNVCVAEFLKTDCTDMFFLDSDVGCGAGVFTRMMHHKADVVGAAYRHKCDTESYPVRWMDKQELWADPDSGLLEVESIATGFLRIQRHVLEKLAENEDYFYSKAGVKCPLIFNTEVVDHILWGEDYVFCKKWRAQGGKVWVDPEITLNHVAADGNVYNGHLGNWLKNR